MPDETVEHATVVSFRKLKLQPIYRIVYSTDDKEDSVCVGHYPYTPEGLQSAKRVLFVALISQIPVKLNVNTDTTPPTILRIRLPVAVAA